jgi:thiaminase/transcriptional activator TenA
MNEPVADYADWQRGDGDDRFTGWLRLRHGDAWRRATEHRFVAELADGSLDKGVFLRYLVQDYVFIETLVTVMGYAVALAPSMPAKKRLTAFLSVLTSDENDYFLRSFDALGTSVSEVERTVLSLTTSQIRQAMLDAASYRRYEDVLAVVVPAEWVYLTWAGNCAGHRPDDAYFAEWIDLHAIPEFAAFVDWLRAELDAFGPVLSSIERSRIESRFATIVALEHDFFEQGYS